MRTILIVTASVLLYFTLPAMAAGDSALDSVKNRVNGVLAVLGDPSSTPQLRAQKIRSTSDEMFDFVELSKRSMGNQWNTLSIEQRKEFVRLYKRLLQATYIKKAMDYTDQKIEFTREVPISSNTVEVQSFMVTTSDRIPVDYEVMRSDAGGWRVYDVIIDGVSLVNFYRSQFRDAFAGKSPDQIIELLRRKVASVDG